ncbi:MULTISPECIES: hypothetical protein [unclassified Sphingomonas]|uniref:hypothetical protein n=1 Tax=unclassified Sphingomonas TaxID=196159 RepID=UPI0006FA39AC|nr:MULTISPECIES: hypothetical protein [unclassified Sphingomonas]KQX23466.1 hypothetical protein ASD17_03985 [Sphingomonas sp. Root1294]KQY68316.1 hypothetical protein ASD39_06505 [Sphingomonas sp. Root50]KRB91216.1 hypothetical protein ASE22_13310 [Sphingomonas sp. Root720]
MLTELRRYAIEPGHMDAMHVRMHEMLFPMFREHGIPAPRAIWENRDESSTLTWMIDWPSFERRLAAWTSFAPLFAAARRAEGTPEIVTRTTLTMIAPWPGHVPGFTSDGGCEALWLVQPRIGFGAAFMALCEAEIFPRFRDAGASAVSASNLLFGPLPMATVFLSWPDAAARVAGYDAIRQAAMPAALAEALLGDGARFGDRGNWEGLDRATYLPRAQAE